MFSRNRASLSVEGKNAVKAAHVKEGFVRQKLLATHRVPRSTKGNRAIGTRKRSDFRLKLQQARGTEDLGDSGRVQTGVRVIDAPRVFQRRADLVEEFLQHCKVQLQEPLG
jgi:hypothetical protein